MSAMLLAGIAACGSIALADIKSDNDSHADTAPDRHHAPAHWRISAILTHDGDTRALAERDDGDVRWLRTGDRLSGCVVDDVVERAVTIDCGATRHRLQLQGRAIALSAAADCEGSHNTVGSAHDRDTITLAATDIATWREDRQRFVQDWTFEPRAGGLEGWTVRTLPPALADAATLKAGDVLTGVDGIPARDPALFIAALSALVERGEGYVSIERDGTRTDRAVIVR